MWPLQVLLRMKGWGLLATSLRKHRLLRNRIDDGNLRKGWTTNLWLEDLLQRVHGSACIFDLGLRSEELNTYISPKERLQLEGVHLHIWSSLFLFWCIDMEDSEYLSYNRRTRFSKKSATYIPIGGRSIFGVFVSHIIIICFLKRFMSVVWLQTTSIVNIWKWNYNFSLGYC